MAEHIESIDELQSELERLKNPNEEELRMSSLLGISIEDQIEEVRNRIRWRVTRQSPAKCLACGQTDFVVLPDADEFAHPVTGERVLVVSRGFAATAAWHAEFTPEGNLIDNQEKRT